MGINKYIVKSLIFSIIIVFAFETIFDMLGSTNSELAITEMIIFTLLLCTYRIIDEIRKLKE